MHRVDDFFKERRISSMQSFVVKPASVIFLLKRSEHISMLCPSATKRYLLLSRNLYFRRLRCFLACCRLALAMIEGTLSVPRSSTNASSIFWAAFSAESLTDRIHSSAFRDSNETFLIVKASKVAEFWFYKRLVVHCPKNPDGRGWDGLSEHFRCSG